jgi:hypothetical protein
VILDPSGQDTGTVKHGASFGLEREGSISI